LEHTVVWIISSRGLEEMMEDMAKQNKIKENVERRARSVSEPV
jgi:hypothetical protein